MSLKCKDPLILGYFSIVNTTVLHDLVYGWLNPWLLRNHGYRQPTITCMWIHPLVVQGSTVLNRGRIENVWNPEGSLVLSLDTSMLGMTVSGQLH